MSKCHIVGNHMSRLNYNYPKAEHTVPLLCDLVDVPDARDVGLQYHSQAQVFRYFFFQDWWAKVTHGAKNGVSFSVMMGPTISK